MSLSNIFKYLIKDYLSITTEKIVVLSGLIDTDKSSNQTDQKYIEELALLIRQVGSFPVLDFDTKELKKKLLTETPEDKYFIPKTYFTNWVKLIDFFIDLSFPDIRNLFVDNFFEVHKTNMINKSLQNIYKNMLITNKIVLLPNFPKTSIANYYQIPYQDLESFYLATFEAITTKMDKKGRRILDQMIPGLNCEIKSSRDNEITLQLELSDQQSYYVGSIIENSYTVLPYGYVALSFQKSSLNGDFLAEKIYYKNKLLENVKISFSYGNVITIVSEQNDTVSEIIEVGLINSNERGELFIGVNNGATEHCNFSYYDRCIDNNVSLIFYDEENNIIEISSKSIKLTDKQTNIL